MSGRETQSNNTISKARTHLQTQSLLGRRFRWRPSIEKEHEGIGGAEKESYGEIWILTSELDSVVRGEFYAAVKGKLDNA